MQSPQDHELKSLKCSKRGLKGNWIAGREGINPKRAKRSMMAKRTELDKGELSSRLKMMPRYQRAEALEQPHDHKGKGNFRVEVVKFIRGITCCKASRSTSFHLILSNPSTS